jgi:hypothetical protein
MMTWKTFGIGRAFGEYDQKLYQILKVFNLMRAETGRMGLGVRLGHQRPAASSVRPTAYGLLLRKPYVDRQG